MQKIAGKKLASISMYVIRIAQLEEDIPIEISHLFLDKLSQFYKDFKQGVDFKKSRFINIGTAITAFNKVVEFRKMEDKVRYLMYIWSGEVLLLLVV